MLFHWKWAIVREERGAQKTKTTPPLSGSAALITGGGRGVGRAIAEAFARGGAAVALVARSRDDLEETRKRIEQSGGDALVIPADITERGAIDEALNHAENALGPIDVLVNNAGTCRALGPVHLVSTDDWIGDIETNLIGAFLATRAVLAGMVRRRRGRIINVASYAAIRATPHMSAYGSAKAALVHFTNTLALETLEHEIRVFAMTPGRVNTDLTRHLTQSPAGRRWLPPISEETYVPVEEAGKLAVFLASGQADVLTGRLIHVLDDIEDLVRRADEINERDLYVLHLRR